MVALFYLFAIAQDGLLGVCYFLFYVYAILNYTEKKEKKMTKVKPVILFAKEDWTQLESSASHAVVQVFAQAIAFNWLEPYAHEEEYEQRATGFFIDEEGHLLTNSHVVQEAKVVWIKIPSFGIRSFFVDVVGICPDRDVALLKLRDEELAFLKKELGSIPYLMLGNSDSMAPTDKVLVLGYPLGQNSLKSSTGIISGRESGLGRTFIQITAPINPGNSGGPLFNETGQVIGIAVATVLFAQNIGFAIPSNDIAMVLDQLYKEKFVRCGILGVRFNNADDVQAEYFGNPTPAGYYINMVLKGSLFDKAGIQEGDMLYYFDQFRIDGAGFTQVPWSSHAVSIYDIVSRLSLGQKIPIILYRNGKKLKKEIVFEITPVYPISLKYPMYEPIDYEIIGGLVIMPLNENILMEFAEVDPILLEYTKLEKREEPALIITHLIPGSRAQQNGSLIPGQIIKEINSIPVQELDDVRNAIKKNASSEFLTIKTTQNVFVVLPFKQIIQDEQRLSKEFSYPISKLIKSLQRKRKNNVTE